MIDSIDVTLRCLHCTHDETLDINYLCVDSFICERCHSISMKYYDFTPTEIKMGE